MQSVLFLSCLFALSKLPLLEFVCKSLLAFVGKALLPCRFVLQVSA